jgi:two-component system, chemotaxis family, CheB/CheR fusion protein
VSDDREPATDSFAELIDYLRVTRGVDLSGYRHATLGRRIVRRMRQVAIDSAAEYVDYLEVHPEEFRRLFDTILINVTSFFRDPETWDVLTGQILPAIIAGRRDHEPIRVWSVGCASGEEACTLAMVWAELLGIEQFRARMKIYATDVDEDALAQARQSTYDGAQMEAVPDDLKSRYFERGENRFILRNDLRRAIIFGRHDLIHDAPMSRLDLLVCRNTLIYLNAETQSRILARFHFALNDTGFLFLGKAETLLTHRTLFQSVFPKHRIFSKSSQVDLRDRLLAMSQAGDMETANRLARSVRLGEEAFNANPTAQLVIDTTGGLILANQMARDAFGLSAKDLGRRFQDLELSYKPIELRSLIQQAHAERRPIKVAGVQRALPSGDVQDLEVHVVPLRDAEGGVLGVGVIFDDRTEARRLQLDLQRATRELETAYEELQSTNEELQTANEELQSAVEELQTTNEELQSTNEEHETTNEELQSTNEELETLNAQLRDRSKELDRANVVLEGILAGLGAGAVVLDRNLEVLTWNRRAEELWGLRRDEVRGRSLLKLEMGLPVSRLIEPLRSCLDGSPAMMNELTVDAVDRRGRTIVCRVTMTPLTAGGEVQGVIMLMDEQKS